MRRDTAADGEGAPLGSPNPSDLAIADDSAPRVLVVSDVRLLREAIARALRAHAFHRITMASERSVLAEARHVEHDVAVLHMTSPSMLQVMRSLAEQHAHIRLIALGIGESDGDVLACAEAGAAGYLPPESGPEELVAAIESVRRDELVCSPHIAAVLFRRIARRTTPQPLAESTALTRREQEVLGLVERGMSNKEIAAQLNISLTTVKNHVHRILEKLNVSRRGAAAARLRGTTTTAVNGPSFAAYTR